MLVIIQQKYEIRLRGGDALRLMELESKLRKCLEECVDEDDRKEVLLTRLKNVSDRIAASMGL
jgi:hypothetical protein